jgi:hypothetical protein
VVLNSFVPLSSSTGTFDASSAAADAVVSSISGLISNVFSRTVQARLQRIFKDNSLRVNFNTSVYNGSNVILTDADQSKLDYDRTNLNFSIGKSFMDEKLTLNVGSALDFGMTTAQEQAAAFEFLPDITAEYKVTPDGRVALTLFYRDSYNYLSGGNHTLNSSGSSISYRRDFDRIDELFKKKKKKPKKEKTSPPPAPNNPVAKDDTSTGSQTPPATTP